MNLDEISVNYYHDSLSLAQKALASGLTVSGIAYLLTFSGEVNSPYVIPFIDIEVKSLDFFSASLLTLYFACGVLCIYGMEKALESWKLISDETLARRVLRAPNILLAGKFTRSCLYGVLFMVGASLASQLLGVSGWKALVTGSLLASPYFLALLHALDFRKPLTDKQPGLSN